MSIIKPFFINETSSIINLTTNLCDTELKVLESEGFYKVLNRFFNSITNLSQDELTTVKKNSTEREVIELYKLLLIFSYDEVMEKYLNSYRVIDFRRELYIFSERLYDFWRRYERYGVIQKQSLSINQDNDSLIEATEKFSKIVLRLYRIITQNLSGNNYQVYRQVAAGVNATLIVAMNKWNIPDDYRALEGINFLDTVIIRTPFMGYSKANTRSGLFKEIYVNPIQNIQLTPSHWICYPVMVGPLIAYVYFHRDFIHHGVALSNLFQPASAAEYLGKKPDLLYVFGVNNSEFDCTYFHDQANDIYVGLASREDKNDYFGYMKKMLLTLHNVYMINSKRLPIHGAMVNITLRNNTEKNIVIIGDSGAGKSETLEALRVIGEKYIREMNVIFDDMGTFFERDGQIVGIGTEIGAFIRLDDLEIGYAYREIDRAFFLNPDKTNARVILPVSDYQSIINHYHVDMVLYANNYNEEKEGIRIFTDINESLAVFREGARKAKGTTSEVGKVTSYFANPFGPVQRQKQTDELLVSTIRILYETKIPVGEIYTKLAIDGYQLQGPQQAAKKLLEFLIQN